MAEKIYIISNSRWDDLEPYIKHLNSLGYVVTNTEARCSDAELFLADKVITLRGYDSTYSGRDLFTRANELNKGIMPRMILSGAANEPESIKDLAQRARSREKLGLTRQWFNRREVRTFIMKITGKSEELTEVLLQDMVKEQNKIL